MSRTRPRPTSGIGVIAAGALLAACSLGSSRSTVRAGDAAGRGTEPVAGKPTVVTTDAAATRPTTSVPEPPTSPSTTTSTSTTTTSTMLAPTTTAPASTAAPPQHVDKMASATLAFVGDVIGLIPNIERASENAHGKGYDFRPMFDRVRALISSADYAICHFEVPVRPEGQGWTPRYVTPGELVTAVADAGFDRCSLASNHALDRGTKGIDTTAAAFDAAGLGRTGTAVSAEDAVPDLVEVNGIRVAHLSYTYGTPGHVLPKDEPWRVNYIDRKRMKADISTARKAGAEYVVVSLHFGKTMITAPDEYQRKITRWLWDNTDVDLIVGCHAHVIQPIDHRGDRYVVYGMGNHLATFPGGPITVINAQDGLLVFATIHRDAAGHVSTDKPSIVPTWVGKGDGSYTIYDARDADDPSLSKDMRKALTKSLWRTKRVVGDYLAPKT